MTRTTTTPGTLRQAVRRAIVRAIVATVAAGLALVIAPHLVTVTSTPGHDAPSVTRPTAPGSPAAALAEAEARGLTCWQGEAPERYAGRIPTHVVWQQPSGLVTVTRRLVGPALDTLFADGTLPGRPIAFCHTTR